MKWSEIIKEESQKDYFINLMRLVEQDAQQYTIYPKHKDLFTAFKFTPLDNVKAVLLGMDPYINPNQAMGLSFSVPVGESIPPSLRNIYKELQSDLNIEPAKHGCLTAWAEQGILLLNSSLTVRQGQSGSHATFGWHTFTDRIISIVNERKVPTVFILWGAHARSKKKLITNTHHLVIESAHPSPLSAYNGFFGSKPFSQTNKFLSDNNLTPIDWMLT